MIESLTRSTPPRRAPGALRRPRGLADWRPAAAAILGVLGATSAAAADEILLRGGAAIRAPIVKRSADSVFIDLGFTVVGVPLAQVETISAETVAAADASAPAATSPEAGGTLHEGVYYTAALEPGSIKDKAAWISESVVKVVCPGKSGSGFIIHDQDGYLLTNFHVVEGDQDIRVIIYERRGDELRRVQLEKVRIVALNPFLDLALLRLESRVPEGAAPGEAVKLKKAFLGDIRRVRPGDAVFAIGNPLGLERTVSEGIVSNQSAAIEGLVYIQTTAAINPGNSGGPLFNDRGEVIGITSLKVRGGESLGFAIPIHVVKDFLEHRSAFAFDKDHPNSGIRYIKPPRKPGAAAPPPRSDG
jgi:serine protease Do